MIRVFLADDHEIFRNGLKSLLEAGNEFKVVGQSSDGERLLEDVRGVRIDCLVLDLSMPNCDGLQALLELRRLYPALKCLVLTMHKDTEHYKKAIANGACGYVLKDCAFHELTQAIHIILQGKHYVSPVISEMITRHFLSSVNIKMSPAMIALTDRERQIVGLIVGGMANKNIAAYLKISIRTVEAHRNRLNHKIGVRNTAALVKYAMEKGLVSV